ncbi:MAG TPA: hypothetical protein VF545_09815 [Thermoleophilaceae bacterium]|jgi:hypothetical protein
MRVRTLLIPIALLAAQLLLAAPALADNGEGLAGETNDKVVTFFCLGIVLLFPLIATLGTVLQSRLEKRREARQAARMRQRVGW